MNYIWEMKMDDALTVSEVERMRGKFKDKIREALEKDTKEAKSDIRSKDILHRKLKRMQSEAELDEQAIDNMADKRLNEIKVGV